MPTRFASAHCITFALTPINLRKVPTLRSASSRQDRLSRLQSRLPRAVSRQHLHQRLLLPPLLRLLLLLLRLLPLLLRLLLPRAPPRLQEVARRRGLARPRRRDLRAVVGESVVPDRLSRTSLAPKAQCKLEPGPSPQELDRRWRSAESPIQSVKPP